MTSKCKGQLHFNYTKLESRESSHNTTLKVYYYSNKDKMKEENTITQLEAIQEKKTLQFMPTIVDVKNCKIILYTCMNVTDIQAEQLCDLVFLCLIILLCWTLKMFCDCVNTVCR